MNEIEITIIAPAHNEADNLRQLVEEIESAMMPTERTFEFIVVDDGSTDETVSVLRELMDRRPWLRALRMRDTSSGRGHGQSAAFRAGFNAARSELIGTLDADLQNPPSDLLRLLAHLESTGADMVQGDRTASRREGLRRFLGTWVGQVFRRLVLGDTIRDTGCSLRVMKREIALRLPLEFRGVHRYIPGTVRRMGYRVEEWPVSHRGRIAGRSKYGLLNRGLAGLFDILAVRWMNRRRRPTVADEIEIASTNATSNADVQVRSESPSDSLDHVTQA